MTKRSMESENRQSPEESPRDAHAIKEVISKVKSQGLFDQFRKECLADVDTKVIFRFTVAHPLYFRITGLEVITSNVLVVVHSVGQ